MKKIFIFYVSLIYVMQPVFPMETALHEAVRNRTLAQVVELIERLHSDINAQDAEGKTPLHRAAEAGQADIVAYLVEQKASLEIEDNDGRTPYFLAFMNQQWGPVYILRAHSVDTNTIDKYGKLPMEYILQKSK